MKVKLNALMAVVLMQVRIENDLILSCAIFTSLSLYSGWACCPNGKYCAATVEDCPNKLRSAAASVAKLISFATKKATRDCYEGQTECPDGCCPNAGIRNSEKNIRHFFITPRSLHFRMGLLSQWQVLCFNRRRLSQHLCQCRRQDEQSSAPETQDSSGPCQICPGCPSLDED